MTLSRNSPPRSLDRTKAACHTSRSIITMSLVKESLNSMRSLLIIIHKPVVSSPLCPMRSLLTIVYMSVVSSPHDAPLARWLVWNLRQRSISGQPWTQSTHIDILECFGKDIREIVHCRNSPWTHYAIPCTLTHPVIVHPIAFGMLLMTLRAEHSIDTAAQLG